MYVTINSQKIWPYLWILASDNSVQWDILEIIYDTAVIELYKNENIRYTLAYKKTKNLLWWEMKYADIINEVTGETFSFQVKNIFLAKIIENDLKVLALVWDEIKLYENFWKSEKLIEPDGDKKEITPLWYYDMFISYDDNYYYPLILNEHIAWNTQIKRFYDYYGYKAYEDDAGKEHLLMLIEDEKSNDKEEIWYFIDNFNIISPKVDFWDDSEYVEEWNISENGDIYITSTSWKKWYLDKVNKKIVEWSLWQIKNTFSFTRIFEDSDGDYIVWENSNWVFIINRNKINLSQKDQKNIKYFKNFITHTRNNNYSFFLVQNEDDEIILLNENAVEILHTDLSIQNEINSIHFKGENIVEFLLVNWEKRIYMIEEIRKSIFNFR